MNAWAKQKKNYNAIVIIKSIGIGKLSLPLKKHKGFMKEAQEQHIDDVRTLIALLV